MKYLIPPLCLSLCLLCASCASKEQVYKHIYNGVKMRERMEQHPLDIALQDQVSYDRYKREKDSDKKAEVPFPEDFAQ